MDDLKKFYYIYLNGYKPKVGKPTTSSVVNPLKHFTLVIYEPLNLRKRDQEWPI